MAYLNQPWFNREIINRFAMATGTSPSTWPTEVEVVEVIGPQPALRRG
jgi:hypothetical protein